MPKLSKLTIDQKNKLISRLAILEAVVMIGILVALLITSITSNNRLADLQAQNQKQAQEQRDSIKRLLEEQDKVHKQQTEYLKCLIEQAVNSRAANIQFTPEGCDVILEQIGSSGSFDEDPSNTTSSEGDAPAKPSNEQPAQPQQQSPAPQNPEPTPPPDDNVIGCLPLINICI